MQENSEALFLFLTSPFESVHKTKYTTERVVSAPNTAYIRIYVYKRVKRTIKRMVRS